MLGLSQYVPGHASPDKSTHAFKKPKVEKMPKKAPTTHNQPQTPSSGGISGTSASPVSFSTGDLPMLRRFRESLLSGFMRCSSAEGAAFYSWFARQQIAALLQSLLYYYEPCRPPLDQARRRRYR